MKFKADRATLIKALAHIQSVAEKRNTIPILANARIDVAGSKLTLTATDMEIAVVEQVDAVAVRDGSTTAPAATLYEIVRKLPDGAEVEFEQIADKQTLRLRAGRFATSLITLSTDDFPSMTAGELPHRFTLSAQDLRGLIDRTRFAISTEETRYYLNGIYLHATQGTEGSNAPVLRAVATDGHRLARVETESLPEGASGMPGVIIPRKTVAELRKLIEEESGTVEIGLSDTRIQFRAGTVTLTSKLIDGTFPEYERVIPRDNDKVLRVGKKDFSDAVGRVSAISSERSRPIKMGLTENLLTLSASSPDQGTATEELDSDRVKYAASPLEIGFQARYLNDITDQIESEVEFHFSDGAAPTIVRDAGDSRALYVLMPMRV